MHKIIWASMAMFVIILFSGCAMPYRMYSGERREVSQVVTLKGRGYMKSFKIDGNEVPDDARGALGGGFVVHILPGKHIVSFYLDYKGTTIYTLPGGIVRSSTYIKRARPKLDFDGEPGDVYSIRVREPNINEFVMELVDEVSDAVVIRHTTRALLRWHHNY